MTRILVTASCLALFLSIGCRRQEDVRVDGSSTVYPATSAAAEMFAAQEPNVRVMVGISGTGGGFKKFLDTNPRLRTDINNASRPISRVEIETAARAGVEFIEAPIGLDGISIVVNPRNTFCDYLTMEELKRIWDRGSTVQNWKDVREGFPDLPLKLYGPGFDSGTFDYFTEAVMGEERRSRSDFTASEDDNTLVQGVSGDVEALGYFGYAYYEANTERLKLVGIDKGEGPVLPSRPTIHDGTYPLARPIFLYINRASLERPAVSRFVDFYLERVVEIVEHPMVGYVSLDGALYSAIRRRVQDRTTGTAFPEDEVAGKADLGALYGRR